MLELVAGFVLGAALVAVGARIWMARREEIRREELEDARRRLAAARGARDAFFDHATHELRSPLSAILGYQELLRDEIFGPLSTEAHDAVLRIGRSGRHLVNLIDGLVELSKLQAGDVEPDPVETDPGIHLSAAAEAFQKYAADRGVAAHVTLPDAFPTIRTDPDRLGRALDLLITSAVRHPATDHMELAVAAQPGRVDLTIGPVKAPEPDTGAAPPGEFGIRLAVVRRTAELLGGGFEVRLSDDGAHRLVFWIRPL